MTAFKPNSHGKSRTHAPDRAFVFATRLGEIPLQDVLTRAGELERQIKDLLLDAPVPAEPARAELEAWMLSVYFENWKARTTSTRYFESDVRALSASHRTVESA